MDTRLYRPVTGSWTSCATGEVPDPPGIVIFDAFVALFTVNVLVLLTFAVLVKICGAKDVFAVG